MKQFPLIRVKFSNERVMAVLFFALVLYQLPLWFSKPAILLNFLIVSATGLIIDLICNVIRYKRPVCSVSAAVTTGIIQAIYPDIPVLGSIVGVAAALILGKHLFGGTGKNIFNPAMVGTLLLGLIFPGVSVLFTDSSIIIPAIILSIPFVIVRPFASAGLISGMILMLGFNHLFSIQNLAAYGVFFWGCIVITDPVTVTYRPFIGLAGGFAAGLASGFFLSGGSFSLAMSIIILALNLALYVLDFSFPVKPQLKCKGSRIGKKVPYFSGNIDQVPAFVHENKLKEKNPTQASLTAEEMLCRIKACGVTGLGGAAFPTYDKIMEVKNAQAEPKFLIVNAVECDPGLIHDHWLVSHYLKEITQGIESICRIIDFKEVMVASKDIISVEFPGNIRLKKVKDFYPAGAEKVLIKNLLNISLAQDTIPAKQGILVLNVQTVLAVYGAVYFNCKATSKYLTCADLIKKQSLVVKAEIGTPINDIVNHLKLGKGTVFKGGGIMQSSRVYEDDIVDGNTNFIAVGSFPRYKESPLCSKCGLCARNCPSGLQVFKIADLVDRGKISETSVYKPQRCVSCGTCSYYCLAGRNLSGKVKEAKMHSSI